MKTSLIFIFFSLILFSAQGQQYWYYDFHEAQQTAKKENKKIIMVFSGSDWCAPCIRMEKKYWESEEFQSYARKHFVMLRVDFPRKKKNKPSKEQMEKNYKLAEKFNPESYFPYVVVLNSEGQVLGTTAYQNISVKEMIALLESF